MFSEYFIDFLGIIFSSAFSEKNLTEISECTCRRNDNSAMFMMLLLNGGVCTTIHWWYDVNISTAALELIIRFQFHWFDNLRCRIETNIFLPFQISFALCRVSELSIKAFWIHYQLKNLSQWRLYYVKPQVWKAPYYRTKLYQLLKLYQ